MYLNANINSTYQIGQAKHIPKKLSQAKKNAYKSLRNLFQRLVKLWSVSPEITGTVQMYRIA